MKERWTPVYDRLFRGDHEFGADPACRKWAWADLCHMAQYEDGVRVMEGAVVPLKRGELVASLRFLAKRWNWSVKRVRNFLDLLQDPNISKLGTVRDTPKGTVYRIVTYDVWANPGHSEGHGEGHDRGTGGAQAGHKEQQVTSVPSVEGSPKKKTRKHRLPDDWQPTDEHRDRAKECGVDLDREVERFRNHADATDRRQVAWNSAFTNWLMKAEEFQGGRGNGNGNATNGGSAYKKYSEVRY